MNGKQIFALILAAGLVLSWLPGSAHAVGAAQSGDVNGNGRIDGGDACLVLWHYGEKITLTEEQLRLADVDGNGRVDLADAGRIAGMIPDAPPEEPEPDNPAEVTLKLNTDGLEMYVGDTATIKATYSGGSGEPTWSSSNESVVTVDKNGKVTAKSVGEAVITASYGGKNAQCMVWVDAKADDTKPDIGKATTISLFGNNGSWSAGVAGNSLTFTALTASTTGNQASTATSNNTSVATVSLVSNNNNNCTFKVSFKGAGSVTITVTSEDGSMSKDINITVKGGYSCNPGGGQLTPEQYASAATGVLVENGLTSAASGSYTVLTMSASELTWSSARGQGETLAHRGWSNGCSRGSVTYEGTNEDGNYIFYLRLG